MAAIAPLSRIVRRPAGAWLLLLLLTLLAPGRSALAQHEYDTWCFGFGHGLKFDGSGGTVNVGSAMSALQGCAAICDGKTGGLMFYTNGIFVWNRFDQMMVNGAGLDGASSAAQAALIVPQPGNPKIYYIFTTDASEEPLPPNGYHYSVVDISLNNGLGDVSVKNVALTEECSEHQTAVRNCNGKDFWVIAHAIVGNTFYAFPVTAAGVGTTPVTSSVGFAVTGHGSSMGSTPQGVMKASPDGTTLAMTYGDGTVEIYDFDRSTGIVSNPVTLRFREAEFYHYGASFSPSGNKLYVSGENGLMQYSLESRNPAIMAASLKLISRARGSDLQLGPDGKIYRRSGDNNNWVWLSVINAPDQTGPACGIVDNGIRLGNQLAYEQSYGLPNNIDALHLGLCRVKGVIGQSASDICQGESVTFDGSGSMSSSLEWSFDTGIPSTSSSATETVVFPIPGPHTVRLIARDGDRADTVTSTVNVFQPPVVDLGPDRYICPNQCIDLTPNIYHGEPPFIYIWSPVENLSCVECASPRACPAATTTYHLTVIDAHGCRGSDSITIYDEGPYVGHLHIQRSLTVPPGEIAEVPVILDDSLDLNTMGTLTLTLHYDSTMMRLLPENPIGSRTSGTLLDGWTALPLLDTPGILTLLLQPPAGVPLTRGNGIILRLRFATFITIRKDSAVALESELPLEARASDECVALQSAPGLLKMSLCGLSYRMIEMTAAKYAIESIAPNPFDRATEIHFSLGLDGPTRVEIVDAQGRHAATLLEGYLQPGAYSLVWDASTFSSGLYYCSITSGQWSQTLPLVLKK